MSPSSTCRQAKPYPHSWNNPSTAESECFDWLLNFPNFKGDIREVTASEWGRGDIRAHHQGWLKHIPHLAGRQNGVHNNWWQYIINPQNVVSWSRSREATRSG